MEVFSMRKNKVPDFEAMTDEEIDEFYRPKKANSRKTLVPLFVYLILREYSSAEKHLTQNEILAYLREDPYEVVIERKALGRVIHLLTDSQLGICSYPGMGTWMGNEDDFFVYDYPFEDGVEDVSLPAGA